MSEGRELTPQRAEALLERLGEVISDLGGDFTDASDNEQRDLMYVSMVGAAMQTYGLDKLFTLDFVMKNSRLATALADLAWLASKSASASAPEESE